MRTPFIAFAILAAITFSAVHALSQTPVKIWEESLTIPTYQVGDPDPNPRFYDGRVTQGAQGRVYPYAMSDVLTGIKEDQTYQAVYLENEYIKLCVLPELGGRLFTAVDKTNGYDFFYRQQVIKPSLIGTLGSWISGGSEWNFPHHHKATSMMRMDYHIHENEDGSATLWLSETERRHRFRMTMAMTIFPDKNIIELAINPYNPTPYAHSFLFFANPAVHVDSTYQVFFPPSVEYATQHAKREFISWPIANGRYGGKVYKDTDISWWKNLPKPVSFFAWNEDDNFFAGYDHGKEAGTAYVANHHLAPGMKFFTFGSGPEGVAWDKMLTDEDGPYLELMSGAFSDNQPDYSWAQPFESKWVKQHWFPVRELDHMTFANLNGAINLDVNDDHQAIIQINTTSPQKNASVILSANGKDLFKKKASIDPANPYSRTVDLPSHIQKTDLHLKVLSAEGETLMAYQPKAKKGAPMPKTVEIPRPPQEIETVEELYFTGLRLDQFYNANLEAMPYYEEALKRDPNSYLVNTQLGILALKGMDWEKARRYLERAVNRVTANHTRSKYGEPLYYYGVALRELGEDKEAIDTFYRATWSAEWKANAYFALAEMASEKQDFQEALSHINRSIETNAQNLRALNLKAALLRKLERSDAAIQVVQEVLKKNPMDLQARNEELLLARQSKNRAASKKQSDLLEKIMLGEPETYLELACAYENAGLWEEAFEVLSRIDSVEHSVVQYHLGYTSAKSGDLKRAKRHYSTAAKLRTDYAFPYRQESLDALLYAIDVSAEDANAFTLLGHMLYDSQPDRAIGYWKTAIELDPEYALVYRNLGFAYSKKGELDESAQYYEKAVSLNSKDPRLFFERDVVLEKTKAPISQRLENFDDNRDVVAKRVDALSRQVFANIQAGNYDEAIELLGKHHFHRWEGANAIRHHYIDPHLLRGIEAFQNGQYEAALQDFLAADEYPENLEMGRPAHASRFAQVYYLIGAAHEKLGTKETAEQYFQKSAEEPSFSLESLYYSQLALRKLGRTKKANAVAAKLQELSSRGEQIDFFAKFGEKRSQDMKQADFHYRRGLALLTEPGKFNEAKAQFEEAIRLNPLHYWAKAYLKNTSPLVVALDESARSIETPWHHPLYLGHNDFWKQRIPVLISNHTSLNLEGDPVTLEVGVGKDQLPIQGSMAESIRVTNQEGKQLLFRVDGPNGKRLEKGSIPHGAILTVPVECAVQDEVTYYIYSGNDSAWPVGEYFFTHREASNGGFETEGDFGPLHWELEWPEENRTIDWSVSEAHSGKRSLELSAEIEGGKGPYGAIQNDIHLLPGASYVVEAWFKGENVKGQAGLILQPENLGRTKRRLQIDSFTLSSGEGSFDWKKARIEFTAPEEANVARIHTFMEGTGKLWIDDVQISCELDYDVRAEILPTEDANVAESGRTKHWFGGARNDPSDWPLRAAITVPNFTDQELEDHPIYVNTQMLRNRLYAEIDENTLTQVTHGTEPIPSLRMGNGLLFKQDIPASTFQTFYVYFSDSEKTGSIPEPDTYSDLSQITENLIANPGFENAEIAGWERFGETETKIISSDLDDGNANARISYTEAENEELNEVHDIETSRSEASAEAQVGLYQTFDVEPRGSYFFSARVKSSNVLARTYTLRARFLDKDGAFTGDEESLRANPDMYQNDQWVQETMILQAPSESHSVRIELLNTTDGEVWYDDVFFMRIGNGSTGALALERKAAEAIDELVAWQVNPTVKVFPDDLPDEEAEKLVISAARNDVEPAQLALRSPGEYKQLEIRVTPPTDQNGNQLDGLEIGVVGYVPINYPSNYYRDFETRFWQTKMPLGTIGSDGWTGWWPDPILPVQTFDLPADMTKTAWIEVSVPEDAAPGTYVGSVSVFHKGRSLKEIPLEMQVYDFVLPEASNVEAAYDLRFNELEMFGRQTTEQEKNKEILEYMKQHRVSTDTIRPEPVFTLQEGEVVVDFTEFDKGAAHYFDELKFQGVYTPWIFYLFGWGHAPRSFMGEAPYEGEYPYHGVDRSQLRPEYVKRYQSALRQYWEHMKIKGWADKVAMYISDEPHAEQEIEDQMKALCDMIHEVDPEIPIYVSTWWYRPEFEGYVDIWGVSHRGGGWGHPVPAEHLQEIRKNGGEIFFTTDGMQCTDTPYLAFERMLPYFCFKYEASKYEFWGANWHTLNPYDYGWHRFHRQSPSEGVWYWMRYPNGDGNFIYPGQPIGFDQLVATTRLKLTREGVEDYEFLNILKQRIENSPEGESKEQAQQALDRALGLVTIPCADGRYTTGYLPDPDVVLAIRHEVASAIESLSN